MIFIFILYFIISLSASIFGAVAGLGGGVIIKPLLDFFGHFDLPTIGVLSAATVLAMATMSLIKLGVSRSEAKIDKTVSLLLASGSIAGGVFGKAVFNYFAVSLGMLTEIALLQSITLSILLTLLLLYFLKKDKLKSFVFENRVIIIMIGFSLGFISAFLGIGGGPLNVAVLILFFSMNTRDAAFNSIFIIFFSQLSALLLIVLTTGFSDYDLSMVGYMITGGVIGGLVGTNIAIRLSNRQIERIFDVAILLIVFINLFNIVKLLN
ncbi:sulfite exporter TauE/SafE family protein [Oceanobacillus neutriphilus]|nr:sulfite exporter TauE/SafE family protein [Oceanobacillus neutriphilus]